jgi:hypothetical protein
VLPPVFVVVYGALHEILLVEVPFEEIIALTVFAIVGLVVNLFNDTFLAMALVCPLLMW